ncbi:threonine synthase [Helicobacter enhydrae]|uniref:Threonine synthase n=1 Tax=Helicobacter enhydrae TaxID=222136 RepID=A0A1B1U545_9HELI|nr:threonine synthase [Helicobacter enhydrae]ANV97879.1 threonine synthase [Helicobacter enhydrae]
MDNRIFFQTRGDIDNKNTSFEDAILHPQADFGGLHTLKDFAPLALSSLIDLDYKELCFAIFEHLHLQTDFLSQAIQRYETFDNPTNPAPLTHFSPTLHIQELYHGPSRAFKDMALQPLASLFGSITPKERYLILTATSGDTGPATLESFKGMDNINVVCFYPHLGTSDVQRLQMTTQNASNLKVLPIYGDFDTAQNILKTLLNDTEFVAMLKEQHIAVSAANSVNFGRIAFQIIYHIWGYLQLCKQRHIELSDEIYSVIPSGNFGNALGAFYAKMMGVPFRKIIIASNTNNILTEWITTGIYDISSKSLLQTHSPAMDILKSSNTERVLFALYGERRTKDLMQQLDKDKKYQLTPSELSQLRMYFDAFYCDDTECLETIKEYAQSHHIIDPHTAVALFCAKKLPKDSQTLVCSTAEWSKFSPTIAFALTGQHLSDQEAIAFLQTTYKLPLHHSIAKLFEVQEREPTPLQSQEVKDAICQWLQTR